jgi:hypothetical protein
MAKPGKHHAYQEVYLLLPERCHIFRLLTNSALANGQKQCHGLPINSASCCPSRTSGSNTTLPQRGVTSLASRLEALGPPPPPRFYPGRPPALPPPRGLSTPDWELRAGPSWGRLCAARGPRFQPPPPQPVSVYALHAFLPWQEAGRGVRHLVPEPAVPLER